MGQTIVEKIAQAHCTQGPQGRPLRSGDFVSIRPHHVMTHDNTSAVMSKFKAIGAQKILDPRQPVFCLDHDIQNRSESNLSKYRAIEGFAREQGVDFYPAGTGIGHQVMMEQLYVVPGSFVVASDSHSNMYGAGGALGTPVVRTDAAAIWATGEFWWQIPRTVQVVLSGKLALSATGKDVIVTLCGLYNQGEVLNAAVEFIGAGARGLSMDERMSIANMTTEWGALVGWFPSDEVTLAYLERRSRRLERLGIRRFEAADFERWSRSPLRPDAAAVYAGRIELDLGEVSPHVSGPDTVQIATPLAELEKQKIAVQKAYLISCVNSRVSDLVAASKVVQGRKLPDSVQLYIAAASKEVQETAEQQGAWQALLEAGAKPLPPGCGPCIGLGAGLLEPGEVGISSTNRNFKGRMGSREARCYLASPEVVVASALAGYICGARPAAGRRLEPRFQELKVPELGGESSEILPGFPNRVRGRLVFLPQDNLNTDGIYGKDYTYRDDVTRELMAQVVMANYDPEFAKKTCAGDVVVAGFNFGTGSSREQAVTALQAKGIALVIAGSYSQTYLRNAFNNGFLCLELPTLVQRLRAIFKDQVAAQEKTILPGDRIDVDFASGNLVYRGETFALPSLGVVPQSLVVKGGIENLVKERLGL